MGYCNVYYDEKPFPTFCYRTGLTVYEERLYAGTLYCTGWNIAGFPLNVLNTQPTRMDVNAFGEPSVFSIEVDGVCLDYSWNMIGFEEKKNQNGTEAILTLESDERPIRVKIHTLLDGTEFFERYIELENLDDNYHAVSRLDLVGGSHEEMVRGALTGEKDLTKYYSLGYFGDYAWGREGQLTWEDVKPEVREIDTRFGRNRFRHPVWFIKNNVMGTIFYVQIAYSGGCSFKLDYKARDEDNTVRMSFDAGIVGYNPMLVLKPKETFTLPEVCIGKIHGGIDDLVNALHTHLRKSVLNMPGTESACLIGSGMGPEHDMFMSTTENYMEQFAKMGAEVFIIDAGWSSPATPTVDWWGYNGVNRPDETRYPDDGLTKIRDKCHALGMKFGLWTEIERLGCNSQVFKDHPEWRNKNRFDIQHPGYLDMTNPEALEWAENEVARIITEYKLDLFRVDYNFDSEDAYFLMHDTGAGYKECVTLRNFTNVYGMYRRLKARFPDVIFENCAGGGGRTDYGQLKAFNHTWVSDWCRAPHSLTITNGMTMVIPPEKVDRLFGGIGGHSYGPLDVQLRMTALGHMTLNVINPPDAETNSDAMKFIRHTTDIYKSFIRTFLPGCRSFHHTPDVSDTFKKGGFTALEIASQDGRKGAISLFSMTSAKSDVYTVFPKGIDPSLDYDVTLDNFGKTFTVSGSELLNTGLRVSLPSSLSSELILYKAK